MRATYGINVGARAGFHAREVKTIVRGAAYKIESGPDGNLLKGFHGNWWLVYRIFV